MIDHIRRALCIASILIAFSAFLPAQPDGPPPGPPPDFQPDAPSLPTVDSDLKKLTKLLSLTADQQAQVKSILTDERARMQSALHESDSADASGPESGQAARAAFKSIRDEANAKIAALLTADQATKFATWQKKQDKAAAQNRDDMPPPPPDGNGPPPGMGGGPPPGP